ncbi:MAG: hypothetical protein EBQ94_09010 [Flavobacteriales bacterium]|nr:hypothetical protein [Crocinitomicaceae bacterium]NBX80501.1 hypothetical protein [Flavobacteriales bacterium]
MSFKLYFGFRTLKVKKKIIICNILSYFCSKIINLITNKLESGLIESQQLERFIFYLFENQSDI